LVEATIIFNKASGSKTTQLNFPNSWNELTPAQLLYIADYWQAWQWLVKENLPLLKVRAQLLLALSGLTKRKDVKALCDQLSFIDESTEENILDVTNFVFEKNTLTKNLFPKLRGKFFTSWVGPRDRLADLSIYEFSFAFDCYLKYSKTNDEKQLNNLVAILYREGTSRDEFLKSGNTKVPFILNLVEQRAKQITKLDDKYKQAVYLFFSGCLDALATQYPLIFKSSGSNNTNATFIDTIIGMSGDKFGSFDETKEQNIYIVFKELTELIVQSEKMNKK